jgi:hypothetical protein
MNNNLPSIDVSSKLAYFQPGMYILRLTEDAPGNVLMVSSSPVGRGTVDFFPGDGVLRNTLTKVGDCVVLRVKSAAGSVLITEFHKDGQQQRIVLKVDKIATDAVTESIEDHSISALATAANAASTAKAARQPVPPSPIAPIAPTAPPLGIVVRKVGHVEGVGDVAIQSGWLGDPTSFSRLEGFAISPLGLPEGVGLQYGVLVEGAQRYASAVSGQFVGTRQKAKALVGVVFELIGPNADKFQVSGQVAFAGLPPLALEPGIPMSGPSGTEQLVALHLSIAPHATQSTAASAWDDPKVTRIARQSPAAAQKATVKKAPAKKAVAKKGTTSRSK